MKYLLTIAAIACALTIITVYFLWPEKQQPASTIAVTVNGHALTKKSIAEEGKKRGYHSEDLSAKLNSVITRELLIQEAQRLKIDQEHSFRTSLKDFYEQSLIKTLMDRKYNEIGLSIDEAEIDHYLSLFGKKVTFTRLTVSSEPPYNLTSEEGLKNEVVFDDLAESLQPVLAGLTPGSHTIKFDTGSEIYAIRLDEIKDATGITGITTSQLPQRDRIQAILEEYKRQQLITAWLNELRDNASITIHSE